jgi:carboxyl-terminal processing protease
VQQVMQFSEDAALKLTTAKYYLPSGRCLQKPDWSTFELVKGHPAIGSDSLYKTDAGRPVFGGGGILPDIAIDYETATPYIEYLQTESCFFDFAIDHIRHHSISPAFEANDAVVEQFRGFLKSHNIRYKGDEQQAFNSFREKLASPSKRLLSALDVIDSELVSKESWQFDSHYKQITDRLTETIVGLAVGEKALYDHIRLKTEPEIRRAVAVIRDGNRYADILSLD